LLFVTLAAVRYLEGVPQYLDEDHYKRYERQRVHHSIK